MPLDCNNCKYLFRGRWVRENSLFRLFVLWWSFFFTWGGATAATSWGKNQRYQLHAFKEIGPFPQSRTGPKHLWAPLGRDRGQAGGSGLSSVRGFAARSISLWLSGAIAACVTQVPVPTGTALKHFSPPQSSRRSCYVLPTDCQKVITLCVQIWTC